MGTLVLFFVVLFLFIDHMDAGFGVKGIDLGNSTCSLLTSFNVYSVEFGILMVDV